MVYDKELNSCTSGCVEILGLHATVAPRRSRDQADPVLESYSFVPYEQTLTSHSSDVLHALSECNEYLEEKIKKQCGEKESKVLREILSELKKKKIQNGFDKLEKEDKSLYDLVVRACEDANIPTKSEIYADKIFGLLRDQPLLDIVIQNSGAENKLLFVEVGGCEGRVYERLASRLGSEPGLRYEYLVTGAGVESLDKDQLENIGVESIQWNFSAPTADR